MTAEHRPANTPKRPKRSDHRLPWLLVALAAVLPLAALLILQFGAVPLGCPGRLVYPYSPFSSVRLAAVAWVLPAAAALGLGVWLTACRPIAGLLLVGVAAAGVAVWTHLAPPAWRNQHLFNALSPSHDGAFVIEALQIDSLADYLRRFPDRARTPPAEMRGTRVISNPPGTTALAFGVKRLTDHWPTLQAVTPPGLLESVPSPERVAWLRRAAALGLVLGALFTILWAAALLPLYAVGRVFFAPPAAAAYAAGCVFTPATLVFTPGKDAAQLLTTALPLLAWLWAVRRRSRVAAAVAGALAVLASLVSLVHVWIVLIIFLATLWAQRTPRPGRPDLLRRGVFPAALAAAATTLALHAAGVDLVRTACAVAAAQSAVTRGPTAMPLAWQALGVPLFLLFAGPLLWCAALWRLRPPANDVQAATGDRDFPAARFGNALLLITVVVLLATVGFTNLETPRLWIPAIPLLTLGLLLGLPPLWRPARPLAALLGVLIFVQVAVAALQWSRMDMRESEHRILEQRFFG